MKIGILTNGGDCPGLNAVIRGVFKCAKNKYDWTILGIIDGYEGLINPYSSYELSGSNIAGILHKGGTILGTSQKGNPLEFFNERGKKLKPTRIGKKILDNIKSLKLDAIITVGGDGTLNVAYDFYRYGINIISVPKTIDNDIAITDYTFGFNSAVSTATEAVDKLHTTAESHHRVMIVEVMGRDAGWIALYAGMAGGADVILIPEIHYDIKKVIQKIKERTLIGKRFSVVVVAEGAVSIEGKKIIKQKAKGKYKIERLGGVSNYVAELIEKEMGIETRVTVLGHIQRGGTPTSYDRVLATRLGVEAVELVAKKKFGHMVALKSTDIISVPIKDVLTQHKYISPDSQIIKHTESIGINLGR